MIVYKKIYETNILKLIKNRTIEKKGQNRKQEIF